MKAFPLMALATGLALGLAAGIAQAQTPTTGTINFTGSIKDVPCEIDTATTATSVSLGTDLDIQTLRGQAGKKSSAKDFKIALKNCGASVAGAVLKFAGATDTLNSKALQVSGGAEGVAVQLVDTDGTTVIDVGSGGAAKDLVVNEGNNVYTFKAQYVSTKDTIKPGQANATALFALTYK